MQTIDTELSLETEVKADVQILRICGLLHQEGTSILENAVRERLSKLPLVLSNWDFSSLLDEDDHFEAGEVLPFASEESEYNAVVVRFIQRYGQYVRHLEASLICMLRAVIPLMSNLKTVRMDYHTEVYILAEPSDN